MAQHSYAFRPSREGAFVQGLPARDLLAEDVDALSDDQRAMLAANLESGDPVYAIDDDLKSEAQANLEAEAVDAAKAAAKPKPQPVVTPTPAPDGQPAGDKEN